LIVFPDGEPPPELLRFTSAVPSRWTATDFAALLGARAAWRAVPAERLPGLAPWEHVALDRIGVPAELVEEKRAADKGAPRLPHQPSGPLVDR
jgi:hypothetical protein